MAGSMSSDPFDPGASGAGAGGASGMMTVGDGVVTTTAGAGTPLLAGGAHFGYTRYPDAGHTETADIAFHDRAHYDWLLKQRRQAE